MNHRFTKVATVVLFACALIGCKAKVDLDNIDPSAKVDMGLALPIGELTFKMGDFLGDSTVESITINENGIYEYQDTFQLKRQYHKIDLSRYVSNTTKALLVKPAVGGASSIDGGTPITMDFPLEVELANVNTDFEQERLDSMVIDSARFTSTFSQNFNLPFGKITSLQIVLPSNVHRAAGQVINIPLDGYDYGDAVPIFVDNFTVDLIKDHSKAPATSNVTNKLTFTIRYVVSLASGESLPIDENSQFSYNFEVCFLDYSAVYGLFKESSQLHNDSVISIADMWPTWKKIKRMHLPVAEPEIELTISTEVAAPLRGIITKMITRETETGKSMKASFGGEDTYDKPLSQYVKVDDPVGTVATNTISFDSKYGNLDKLFSIRPDSVEYSIELKTDQGRPINQYRLTRNTKVDIDAALKVPFIFNEGVDLEYADTIDLDLSKLDVDSLVAEVDNVDSITFHNLRLVVLAKSYIPWDVEGTYKFLDENGNDLKIEATEGNKIYIAGPTNYNEAGAAMEPGTAVITIAADQETIEKLKLTRKLVFDAIITDVDVNKLKNKNVVFPVCLRETTSITFKVALSADVSAYLKLEFSKDNNE